MTCFDPWTATLEEALSHHNAHAIVGGSVLQQVTASELTAKRKEIESGDGFGVLAAVARCAIHGLAMPDWLARAYLTRYRAVEGCRVESWDAEESFGRPYRKGVQISALRRKRLNRIKVANEVRNAINRNPERIIDVAFWEEIGLLVGEGKTNAQKLYSEAVRMGITPTASNLKSKLKGRSSPAKSRKLTGLLKR